MTSRMPRRFARLPVRRADAGWRVVVAATWRARLVGLAGLRALPDRVALLLPACRSLHTFAMRFALDLVWLDAAGAVVRIDREVRPRRVRWCRRARSVLEAPAGSGIESAIEHQIGAQVHARAAAGGVTLANTGAPDGSAPLDAPRTAGSAADARAERYTAPARRRAITTATRSAPATTSATSAHTVTSAAATTTSATTPAAASAAGANRASSSGSGR